MICKVTYNTYIRQYSVVKVDYRGAAAPKNTVAISLCIFYNVNITN